MHCVFCEPKNEQILFTNDIYRVISVTDKYYPGYIQIVANKHLKELTDLAELEANSMFLAILRVEKFLRQLFNPDKINIASFGNVVPHLHWHVIPRFRGDRHFPNSIWGEVTQPEYTPSLLLQNSHLQLANYIFDK